MRHHLEKAIQIISRIEAEHLDYQMQLRRLQDVASRFAPMMRRLDGCLPSIQTELDMPVSAPMGRCEDVSSVDLVLLADGAGSGNAEDPRRRVGEGGCGDGWNEARHGVDDRAFPLCEEDEGNARRLSWSSELQDPSEQELTGGEARDSVVQEIVDDDGEDIKHDTVEESKVCVVS